jgi:hypothetical protein
MVENAHAGGRRRHFGQKQSRFNGKHMTATLLLNRQSKQTKERKLIVSLRSCAVRLAPDTRQRGCVLATKLAVGGQKHGVLNAR